LGLPARHKAKNAIFALLHFSNAYSVFEKWQPMSRTQAVFQQLVNDQSSQCRGCAMHARGVAAPYNGRL
jgi:putative hemolysin